MVTDLNEFVKDLNENHKPWEQYPHIWETEAQFWAYLRGAIREAVWNTSPIKLDFKNTYGSDAPPPDYTGRGKKGTYCALTGEWVMKSKLQVDHIDGEMPLRCWADVLPFVLHNIPKSFDHIQLVSIEAHKIKSHLERYGQKKGLETFEEAKADKMTIDFFKNKKVDTQISDMQNMGIDTSTLNNINKRKAAVFEYFLEELNR